MQEQAMEPDPRAAENAPNAPPGLAGRASEGHIASVGPDITDDNGEDPPGATTPQGDQVTVVTEQAGYTVLDADMTDKSPPSPAALGSSPGAGLGKGEGKASPAVPGPGLLVSASEDQASPVAPEPSVAPGAGEGRWRRGQTAARSPMQPPRTDMKRINALNLEPVLPKPDDEMRNDRKDSPAMLGPGVVPSTGAGMTALDKAPAGIACVGYPAPLPPPPPVPSSAAPHVLEVPALLPPEPSAPTPPRGPLTPAHQERASEALPSDVPQPATEGPLSGLAPEVIAQLTRTAGGTIMAEVGGKRLHINDLLASMGVRLVVSPPDAAQAASSSGSCPVGPREGHPPEGGDDEQESPQTAPPIKQPQTPSGAPVGAETSTIDSGPGPAPTPPAADPGSPATPTEPAEPDDPPGAADMAAVAPPRGTSACGC